MSCQRLLWMSLCGMNMTVPLCHSLSLGRSHNLLLASNVKRSLRLARMRCFVCGGGGRYGPSQQRALTSVSSAAITWTATLTHSSRETQELKIFCCWSDAVAFLFHCTMWATCSGSRPAFALWWLSVYLRHRYNSDINGDIILNFRTYPRNRKREQSTQQHSCGKCACAAAWHLRLHFRLFFKKTSNWWIKESFISTIPNLSIYCVATKLLLFTTFGSFST